MKSEGALRRLFRHLGIYRSDVSFLLVNPVQLPPPVGRPRYRAIARDGRSTPCPSSAMSSGRLFLDRVARQQCPSPLHRHRQNKTLDRNTETIYHRTAHLWCSGCLTQWVHPNSNPFSRKGAKAQSKPQQIQAVQFFMDPFARVRRLLAARRRAARIQHHPELLYAPTRSRE